MASEREKDGVAGAVGRGRAGGGAPNAPQDNPLAQMPAAVRNEGLLIQRDLARTNVAKAGDPRLPQTSQMMRGSPQIQAWAQGQQQQQARMNTALAANGGTLNPQQARTALGQQGEVARAGLLAGLSANARLTEANRAAAPAAPALAGGQGWGKTAYGDNVVGRKTDNGYAFSNQAADVAAAGNNRFVGRGGANGRISNNGSFHTMQSEDMWRPLGGSGRLPAQGQTGTAGGTRQGQGQGEGMRVNVVRSLDDTHNRNAALKTQWRGEELIRQGKNTRRARGGQDMVRAGLDLLGKAEAIRLGAASAPAQRDEADKDRALQERMNAGRQGLEQAQAAALEQQTQAAQQAQAARQQQQQTLQRLQALVADPSASPEQRQLAEQSLRMMTPPDPKRYQSYNLGESPEGLNLGQGWLDTYSGQPLSLGGLEGQGGARAVDEGWYEFPDGRRVRVSQKYGLEALQ